MDMELQELETQKTKIEKSEEEELREPSADAKRSYQESIGKERSAET